MLKAPGAFIRLAFSGTLSENSIRHRGSPKVDGDIQCRDVLTLSYHPPIFQRVPGDAPAICCFYEIQL